MACITPFFKKDQPDMGLPCGKCPDCLTRRASGWSFRLMQEYKRCVSAYFITLTYNTQYVPISSKGWMTLRKSDVQLFMKRLRKQHAKDDVFNRKLRYYVAGEYGTYNNRPHYHMLLFNANIDSIPKAWRVGNDPIGHIDYGNEQFNAAMVGYTLKYMTKPSKIPLHQNDDRQKEFSLMSKGLGENYLTPQMIAWHHADLTERMYLNLEGGKKISMPRYYKNKIYDDDWQRPLIAHSSMLKARIRQDEIEAEMVKLYGEHDWRRVKAETDFYSFQKMYKNANKNRNL